MAFAKKTLVCLFTFFILSAAPTQAEDDNRMFMPKNSVRGYADFAFAPPHNEIGLNRCLAGSGAYGGENAPCSAFARYALGGYIEIQPFGRGPLSRFFFFIQPNLFMGNNVPQVKYTYSAQPIAIERFYGMGIELPKNFELRLTNHRTPWLGKYKGNLGPADLGPNGPYELYTTISVRWRFGGWKKR
jgi:hypothetical protein